jgi:regulation of enolase protein 1 (concanavalin A-like superfamily)
MISAYRSSDGSNWTLVGTATVTLPHDVLIGLAVTSHSYGRIAAAAFRDVSVTATPGTSPAPPTYATQDIGNVGVTGATVDDGDGSYTVTGAGADIWGNADAFRYMFQPISGDFDIEARVGALDPVHAWTKTGVMVRETLRADSRHAFALVSAGKGVAHQYRTATAGASAQAAVTTGAAPRWVKITRRGSLLQAFTRTDTGAWQGLGSATIAMTSSVYTGVAITSHDATRTASADISNVRITRY